MNINETKIFNIAGLILLMALALFGLFQIAKQPVIEFRLERENRKLLQQIQALEQSNQGNLRTLYALYSDPVVKARVDSIFKGNNLSRLAPTNGR